MEEAASLASPAIWTGKFAVVERGGVGMRECSADDLGRKKAEQAEAREAIKAERQGNVAAGGAAGQQGGPANPVGKDNYPNGGPLSL